VAIQGTTPGAIELLNPGGLWIPVNDNDVYRVATTDYVSKISNAYSRLFQGRDELEVEPEIRLAAHDEFAALALCTDQERDAYFRICRFRRVAGILHEFAICRFRSNTVEADSNPVADSTFGRPPRKPATKKLARQPQAGFDDHKGKFHRVPSRASLGCRVSYPRP
jgi:hypothetical protein